MSRGRIILCWILVMIPVLAILALLAMMNVVYMLLGAVAVLLCLVVLKQKKPGLFAWRKPQEAAPKPIPMPPGPTQQVKKSYLILVELGSHEENRIKIDKPLYYIGRGDQNDYSLDDPRIGRRHLSIEYRPQEDACYATDLGSVNGTYLNSERMKAGQPFRLVQGDRITFNDRPFEVEYAHF